MKRRKPTEQDVLDAVNIIVGYCCKEIYMMGTAFPAGHFLQVAAHNAVASTGVSWPEWCSEHADTLGRVDVRDF